MHRSTRLLLSRTRRIDTGREATRTRVQRDGSVGSDGEEVHEEVRGDRCAGWPRVAAEAIRRTRLHFGDVRAVHRGGGGGGRIAATGAVVERALQCGCGREERE